MNINKDDFARLCGSCNGAAEVLRRLNLFDNGVNRKKLKELSDRFNVNLPTYKPAPLYKRVKKICPVCNSEFEALLGNKREKHVCSRSCANSFFRSGKNHPNYGKITKNDSIYRSICFDHHKRECLVCGFNLIVEVHHVDHNKQNNEPKNLVPLCPNHHRMVHSRFKDLVQPKIEDYLKNYGV